MKTETLRALGINLEEMDARVLLDEHFDGKSYGLSESGCRKVALLREFISEYREDLSKAPAEQIKSSDDAVRLVEHKLRGIDHEQLWVAFLNRSNIPIETLQMTKGTIDCTGMDNRQILRTALLKKATAVILFHNHPSGNPMPGTEDIKATESLRNAAKVFDIALLDHIIVSDSKWYSFAEEKTSKFNR